MMSFKEFCRTLLLCYDANLISDEDFIIFYELFSSRNPDFVYNSYNCFNLDEMNGDECNAEFRVRKRDLPTLAQALGIPLVFHLSKRSVVDGMEGFCMLLRRLAYPCRYGDLIHRFGRPVLILSMATNHVLDYIYNTHGHLITHWNHTLLSPPALEVYTNVINQKGAPLQNCFGFVDGTVRPIARPDEHQRIMYNGHKRVHALKFQSIALPNGMIGNLFGPVGQSKMFLSSCLYFSFCFLYMKPGWHPTWGLTCRH